MSQTDARGKDWDGALIGDGAPRYVRKGASARRVMDMVDVLAGEHDHVCSDVCGQWQEST